MSPSSVTRSGDYCWGTSPLQVYVGHHSAPVDDGASGPLASVEPLERHP
jgi:hypothetical protein